MISIAITVATTAEHPQQEIKLELAESLGLAILEVLNDFGLREHPDRAVGFSVGTAIEDGP